MPDGQTMLFCEPSLADRLRTRLQGVRALVEEWDPDDLLARTDSSIAEQIYDHEYVEPVELVENEQYAKEAVTKRIDMQRDYRYSLPPGRGQAMVPHTIQEVVVPVQGDTSLLKFQPSSFSLNPPVARVLADAVVFTYQSPNPTPQSLATEYNNWLEKIRAGVNVMNSDIARHNQALDTSIRDHITARRARLLQDRELSASLQLPIRRRRDTPNPVPLRRRRIALRPTTPTTTFRPDPELAEDMYEEALATIAGMGSVMERNPTTFHKLHEPALRDHLLLQLNNTFEGQAMGEVFNGHGKTDILIRVQDRNVFIAECKKWSGPARFKDAVDQLLRYQTWRDAKAALVLFITARDASAIIEKATQTLRAHPSYLRAGALMDPLRRIDAVLRATDDQRHEIRVALLPLVVPATAGSSTQESP